MAGRPPSPARPPELVVSTMGPTKGKGVPHPNQYCACPPSRPHSPQGWGQISFRVSEVRGPAGDAESGTAAQCARRACAQADAPSPRLHGSPTPGRPDPSRGPAERPALASSPRPVAPATSKMTQASLLTSARSLGGSFHRARDFSAALGRHSPPVPGRVRARRTQRTLCAAPGRA